MQTASYGSWESPITSDLIVAETIVLDAPCFDGDRIFFGNIDVAIVGDHSRHRHTGARFEPVEHRIDQFGLLGLADERAVPIGFKESRADQLAVAFPKLKIVLPLTFIEQHFIGDAALYPNIEAAETPRVPVRRGGICPTDQIAGGV